MATLPTPAAASVDPDAHDRAARRLQAWASRHPDAAALAALASLAVRIDSALLRRLRLQLLPRAEPGTEADVWFSGLHESRGGDGVVLDAGVQRLLRARLAQQPADDGGVRPLDAAWRITAALHADAPEAIRTEEALTWEALRAGDDLPGRIDTLLAPALAAMAGGGEARALEVARWAQRAVPRLPDAARRHPSALALWLASLMRLGLPASRLPDTGEAGLPTALQWLLPQGQVQALQRVDVTPFDDALLLLPLADDAPETANEISLPRTKPLLLALQADDANGSALLQRTAALASVGATTLALPPAWHGLQLCNLRGEGWRLQRSAPASDADTALPAWLRMRALVIGPDGAVGTATFVSPSELVTVQDVLAPELMDTLRQGRSLAVMSPLVLGTVDAAGDVVQLPGTAVAIDPRSSLVLLTLPQPFAGALPAPRLPGRPVKDAPGWTMPDIGSERGPAHGRFDPEPPAMALPAGRAAPDALGRHIGLQLPWAREATTARRHLAALAGAPVFEGDALAGIVDLGAEAPGGQLLRAIPAAAVERFLAWARRPEPDWPEVLLHHPVDDTDGKGAAQDEIALGQLTLAARLARVRLQHDETLQGAYAAIDDAQAGPFAPGLAAAVRLVTPATREGTAPAARLRLLALAARHWVQPNFGVLNLAFRTNAEHTRLPPPLRALPMQDIDATTTEALTRQLLDLADPAPALPPLVGDHTPSLPNALLTARTHRLLAQGLPELARPFAPADPQVARLTALVGHPAKPDGTTLTAVADLVMRGWTRSSRLDATPFVDALAALALPLHSDNWLMPLRDASRGAWVSNAMPVQFGRVLISRAHAGSRPPPCIVVRAQAWEGAASVDAIEAQVIRTIATALDCTPDEARTLLKRLDLPLWILVATRPLPDKQLLLQLELRLPSARWLFLAGPDPDIAKAAPAIGAQLLPLLPERADMVWLQGYKRLMEWARPRHKSKVKAEATKATRATPRKPLRK